jgi:2-oxoglutarate dehydrogenase E2 component (dihydrolipoamide succinyltransferase)
MADITMPQLGETVTEGTITRWAKQVGDKIEEDEVLFEVSTDKVDSEVPSPATGYLAEILVQEGETVDVGAKLAVISDGPPSGNGSTAPAEAEQESPSPEPQPEAAEEPEQRPADEPRSGDRAEASEASGVRDQPPGDPDAAGEADSQAAEAAPAQAQAPSGAGTRPADNRPSAGASGGGGDAKVLSPVVRRLIAEHNLKPEDIEGTGAGGRITRADVLAVIDRQGGGQTASGPQEAPAEPVQPEQRPQQQGQGGAPAPAQQRGPQQRPQQQQAPAQQAPAPQPISAGERDEVIAFTNIRKRTAEHMVKSKATSAHTLVAVEADYAGVEKARAAAKDRWRAEEGFALTYLPFIARAVIDAIREFPKVNSSVANEELIVHHYVNLGVAVDLNFEGLLVPVVKEADGKRLRAIAREINDLANRARSKRLGVDELSGGTFTITNPGPFGTFITVPVINQPQIAILSTDGIKKRPVVVSGADGSDAIAIHPVGMLALSFDHRAVDGAYASAFVAKVKEIIETRDWAAEL